MEVSVRKNNLHPITHYWGMVKEMSDDQKLELVTMLINSVRVHPSSVDEEQERERGFRNLAGCWAKDADDIESIIREGRKNRQGSRTVPDFDEL